MEKLSGVHARKRKTHTEVTEVRQGSPRFSGASAKEGGGIPTYQQFSDGTSEGNTDRGLSSGNATARSQKQKEACRLAAPMRVNIRCKVYRHGRDALPRDPAWHVHKREQMPYLLYTRGRPRAKPKTTFEACHAGLRGSTSLSGGKRFARLPLCCAHGRCMSRRVFCRFCPARSRVPIVFGPFHYCPFCERAAPDAPETIDDQRRCTGGRDRTIYGGSRGSASLPWR